MIRKENLILTFASGSDLFRSPTFWVFVNSAANSRNADLVILTNDIPPDVEQELDDLDVHVEKLGTESTKDVYMLFRDRHMAFWKYLNEHGHKYKHVLVTDCRDVVFQANPFCWIDEYKARLNDIKGDKSFFDHFVVLVSEGFKRSQSGFACIEHFEFQRDVPRPFLQDGPNRPVVNAGIILGTPRAVQSFHFLVWSVTLKTIGRCTDQATINYLLHYLEDDDMYSISHPQRDNLCLTGEGIKEGSVEPVLTDEGLTNPQGKLYYLVHQWDRIDHLREHILAHYGT